MQQIKLFFLILLGSALLAYGAKVPGCEQASQDCCAVNSHCPADGKKDKNKDCMKSCCMAAVALLPAPSVIKAEAEAQITRKEIFSGNKDRVLQFIIQIEHPPNIVI